MHVSVAAGFLPRLGHAPQLGKNIFQISGDRLKSLRLRAHRKQLLLEIEIEGQRSG